MNASHWERTLGRVGHAAMVGFCLLSVMAGVAMAAEPVAAKPPEVVGRAYRSLDGKRVIFVASASELEIHDGEQNLVCKYKREGDKLQIVVDPQGTTTNQRLDIVAEDSFAITPEGLVNEDGVGFYEPTLYQEKRDELIELGADPRHPDSFINVGYNLVRGQVLGAYLAKKFAGKRALIVLPPEMPFPGAVPAKLPCHSVLAGLEKTMTGVTIIGELQPKMPADVKARFVKARAGGVGMNPMWFDVPRLNEALQPYQGKYDLLILLTMLPGVQPTGVPNTPSEPYTKLDCWADENVKVALTEGGISTLGEDIASGKICAVMTYRQRIADRAWDEFPPADPQEAFDRRYVLITPDNIKDHQSYFSQPTGQP